jgi:DNA processing protein
MRINQLNGSSERDYLVALASCPGLEPGTLQKLVLGCGDARRVWEGDKENWSVVCRLSEMTIRNIERWRNRWPRVAEVESFLQERGINVITKDDPEFPVQLTDLEQPPLVLFIRSEKYPETSLFTGPCLVSVVGTRRASAYAIEATRWIVGSIAPCGWHVISGLALGIDVSAHEAALAAGGVTSAVLACGVDLCYPVNHKHTYNAIRESGCLLSEYPPGTPVAKHRFPERNRLIAALAPTLIVVQAGEKSGALTTAAMALELGRDIYVVPGPITSTHYVGSNRLIGDGAMVLISPNEFLLTCGQNVPTPGQGARPPERWRCLYDALMEPLGADALSTLLGVPMSHVYAGLLELELAGWIERRPGAIYGWKSNNLHPNSAGC